MRRLSRNRRIHRRFTSAVHGRDRFCLRLTVWQSCRLRLGPRTTAALERCSSGSSTGRRGSLPSFTMGLRGPLISLRRASAPARVEPAGDGRAAQVRARASSDRDVKYDPRSGLAPHMADFRLPIERLPRDMIARPARSPARGIRPLNPSYHWSIGEPAAARAVHPIVSLCARQMLLFV